MWSHKTKTCLPLLQFFYSFEALDGKKGPSKRRESHFCCFSKYCFPFFYSFVIFLHLVLLKGKRKFPNIVCRNSCILICSNGHIGQRNDSALFQWQLQLALGLIVLFPEFCTKQDCKLKLKIKMSLIRHHRL